MIEKTVYVADDGKEFETEEECMVYEKRDAINEVLNAVTLCDIDGDMVKITTNLKDFVDTYNQTFIKYLIVDSSVNEEDLARFSNFLYHLYGVEFPTCAGKYRWDDDQENWIEFEEELKLFKAMWDGLVKLEIKTR